MTRQINVNGESLILVKGASNTSIANLAELGLAEAAITLTPEFNHDGVTVDAWGKGTPEVQYMLAAVNISFTLVHYDPDILDVCIGLSMGGGSIIGQTGRAGTLMGGGVARFSPGWLYVSLNITSPVQAKPWNFLNCYMQNPPMSIGLGTERSLPQINFRCVPYTQDPYQGGVGATDWPLWRHVLDS